jgi:beta-N-acetylhexosaminidase
MNLESICGSLLVGGFAGTSLPESYARALRENRRSGAILFRQNVHEGPFQVASLARQVHAASPAPLLGIDQEGGRVARLREPFIAVPAMSFFGSVGDPPLAETVAHAVGLELAAVGCTINFAPVLDVNTCAHNPVIGDRAFSSDPEVCARFGVAWIRGLERAGVLATPKHFPGHGDTSSDSHLDLPIVQQPLERLERVEMAPFRAAIACGVRTMMTGHVVYTSLDPALPATLSPAVCTRLRERLGFEGVLLSDDLQMRAVADTWSVAEAAIMAIAAGCDGLLICHGEDAQETAFEALTREAERSTAFAARCEQAHARVRAARSRVLARPASNSDIARIVGGAESKRAAREIAARLGR